MGEQIGVSCSLYESGIVTEEHHSLSVRNVVVAVGLDNASISAVTIEGVRIPVVTDSSEFVEPQRPLPIRASQLVCEPLELRPKCVYEWSNAIVFTIHLEFVLYTAREDEPVDWWSALLSKCSLFRVDFERFYGTPREQIRVDAMAIFSSSESDPPHHHTGTWII
ncbi:hypothetical protein [Haladaptatus sp. ZSTT2]|uniref:hypothetical protein n=1 Tax=Haladaptatus sp. ZSTT2 TaxID=3120515 RepID=UPI00300EB7D3